MLLNGNTDAPSDAPVDKISQNEESEEEESDDRSQSMTTEVLILSPEEIEQVRKESAFDDFAALLRGSTAPITISNIFGTSEQAELTMTSREPSYAFSVASVIPRFQSFDTQSISDFLASETDIRTIMSPSHSVTSQPQSSTKIDENIERKKRQSEIDKQIEREFYYKIYSKCNKQFSIEKSTNNYLHRKVAEYYRKRKMYHVLMKETTNATDNQKKYEKNLDELNDLSAYVTHEKIVIENELDSLKNLKYIRTNQVNSLFDKFQQSEIDFLKEMIIEGTSKWNSDKIMEHYLKRQSIQLSHLIKIRYKYIKLRTMFTERQEQLNSLDNLGPNLYLVDYQQLKLDNRNLLDKLEERENELTKVRAKCQNIMQILAHRREKTAAIEADIPKMIERYDEVLGEYEEVRMQLNDLKQERDSFRQSVNKMKEESGLITKSKLLNDMEITLNEHKRISQELDNSKRDYYNIERQFLKLRKNMNSNTKLENLKTLSKSNKLPPLVK